MSDARTTPLPRQPEPTLAPNWAEHIRRHRRATGLTQAQLAARLNVDQATVSRWERALQLPELPQQKALRDLFHHARQSDAVIARRIDILPVPAGLIDRSFKTLALSRPAASLLSVEGAKHADVHLEQMASEMAIELWYAAEQAGFFEGEVAYIEARYGAKTPAGLTVPLVTTWLPVTLSGGETAVHIIAEQAADPGEGYMIVPVDEVMTAL